MRERLLSLDGGPSLLLPTPEEYAAYVGSLPPVQEDQLPDGRQITWREMGPENGLVVFSEHGNPGSSATQYILEKVLYQRNIRLISRDRPGYGGSTPHPDPCMANSVQDVAFLADKLGAKQFGIVAGSGGVPHALACAALLPERVMGLVGLSGIAPHGAYKGELRRFLSEDNQAKYKAAEEDPDSLAADVRNHATANRDDPFSLVRHLFPSMKPDDIEVLNDIDLCCAIAAGHTEGLCQNGQGWVDDMVMLFKPWGENGQDIDLSAIQAPSVFWHGLEDPFSSHWNSTVLSLILPDAVMSSQAGASHFRRFLHLKGALLTINQFYRESKPEPE